MTLYKKELIRILKSLIFLIVAAGIVIFTVSQGVLPPNSIAQKPQPGQQSYGMTKSEDPQLIMPEATKSLFAQFSANSYVTYPNGFYKAIKLNQADNQKMQTVINSLGTQSDSSEKSQSSASENQSDGLSIKINGSEGKLEYTDGDGLQITIPQNNQITDFKLNPNITWSYFCELMKQADDILGGGSDFSEQWISHRFGQIPITYEQALADYEMIVDSDKITGAHARLFSDYVGIISALLPVFISVFILMRDRKNVAPMLYTRKVSSLKLTTARFCAALTACMLPILIMGVILTFMHIKAYPNADIDLFAYLKYSLFWIMPTVMLSISVGMFFTVLTNTPIAIGVQLLWWFYDTMIQGSQGAYNFLGVNSLFTLVPRHNSFGNTKAFLDYLPKLIQNRIAIAILALALVLLTALIFNIKRRGMLNVSMFSRNKIQSEG